MGAKGGGKSCCCLGCGAPITDMIPVVAVAQNSPWQQSFDTDAEWSRPSGAPLYCLACMPEAVCVQVACNGVVTPGLLTRLEPSCVPYEAQAQVNYKSFWDGSLSINESVCTLRVIFDVDPVYGDCHLCLQCPALGITGQEPAARVLIDSPIRSLLSPSCQGCLDPNYPPVNIQWNLTLNGCDATITMSPADTTSLLPTTPCPGCPDPCDGVYSYFSPASTVNDCTGICLGCDCICTHACITVSVDGQFISNERVRLCNYSWVTSQGTAIGIDAGYGTGQCQLTLTGVGGVPQISDPLPQGLPIGTLGNPCPWPTAEWQLGAEGNHHVSVFFNCAECGTCDNLIAAPCCPVPVPRLLHVTFDGSACGCPTLNIPVFNATIADIGPWLGSSAQFAFCDKTVSLQLTCEGLTEWILVVAYHNGGGGTYTSYRGSCSPMSLVFDGIDAAGSGDCKCQPPWYPICNKLTASVTE